MGTIGTDRVLFAGVMGLFEEGAAVGGKMMEVFRKLKRGFIKLICSIF